FGDASVVGWPLVHSAWLAGLTAAASILIGVPLGVLLGKTDLPLRRFFTVVLSVPLVLPPYVLAVSWFTVLSADGPLAGGLPPAPLRVLSAGLFGLGGSALVLSTALMPLLMLMTQAHLRAVVPRLE